MSVRRNATALYGVQLANYALPLVTLPYLSHMLGPAGFGSLGLAQTIAQILLIFTDFGFDLTSTRKIAIARDDKSAVTRIYWTTIIAKCLFAALSSLLMVGLAAFVFRTSGEGPIICLAIMMIWGSVLTPTWLFQGIQKMPTIAICAVLSRAAMLPLIFLFVKSRSDLPIAALLQFSPMMIAGLLLTLLTFRMRIVSRRPQLSLETFINEIKDSSHIFFSSALTSVYMYANVLILRGLGGVADVGYYVAAEKITTPLRQIFTPPIQAYFPRACGLYKDGRAVEVKSVIRKMVLIFFSLAVVAFLSFQILGHWFVTLFFGQKFIPTFGVLRILITVPMLIGIAAVMVQLCIIATGNQAKLKKIYAMGAIFHLIQAPIMVYYFGARGSAYSVFATELLMTGMLVLTARSIFRGIAGADGGVAVADADIGMSLERTSKNGQKNA